MAVFKLRKSSARGYANHGWLESYHSFSFAEYYDPAHMGFSVLRVINEDVVAAGTGFGMHPHRDMEIITYMLAGELRHQDSMDNTAVIKAGDVQRMTAGTGVRHSEVNASTNQAVHLLQIWIQPSQLSLQPSYEDKHFGLSQKLNQWCLIASHDGRAQSLTIHQNVNIYASLLEAEKRLSYMLEAQRKVYIQVVKGQLAVNGQVIFAGDALMVDNNESGNSGILEFQANVFAELLLFDLPN